MTLNELLIDAITYEEPKLAYAIYWASMNGLDLNGNFETFKNMEIDYQAVDELIKINPLGISRIKLYSCKKEDDLFHFVLAETEIDARNEIFKHEKVIKHKIHDVSHGMDKSLWDVEKGKSIWIRGIKDAALVFPHYIGLIERTD